MRRIAAHCAALLSATAVVAASEAPRSPDQVAGLVAWYRVDTLHARMRDGDLVRAWPDSSAHARDMQPAGAEPAARLHVKQLDGKPAIAVNAGTRFGIEHPFVLQDHTIFLVHRTTGDREKALFSDRDDDLVGIALDAGGSRARILRGGSGWSYTAAPATKTFAITVLAREAGRLLAFVDGADVSSQERCDLPLRVGRFFHLRATAFVEWDGGGLAVAELAFFDRKLADDERHAVEAWLSAKYGIPLIARDPTPDPPPPAPFDWERADVRASLGAKTSEAVGETGSSLSWDAPSRVDAPLRHGGDEHPTRLYGTAGGTTVRVGVTVSLELERPQGAFRVLLLRNGTEYLPEEGRAEVTAGGAGPVRAGARFETELTLAEGDFLEVVVAPDGAAAPARTVPAECELRVATVQAPPQP